MRFIKNKFLRKTICLGLSAVLIYNTTVPAFGQEFLYKLEEPTIAIDKTYYDNTQAEIQAAIWENEEKEHERKMQNPGYSRAEEIKYEILGDPVRDSVQEYFGDNKAENEEIDFKAEYIKALNEGFNSSKEEITTDYNEALQKIKDEEKRALASGEFIQEEVAAWKKQELSKLKKSYNETLAELDKYLKQEVDRVNNHYDEFLAELQEGANESFFQHVKTLFNELMEIYVADPKQAREQILEITPVIVSLVSANKERVYNKNQQEILLKLYREVIKEENAKVGNDKSSMTNPCEHRGYCLELTNAIMGLGILSTRETQRSDGYLIQDTINNYEDTAANISVMLSGISALLVMEDYDMIDKYLNIRSVKEHKINYWDEMNFMAIPKHIANVNGKYLGASSIKAEYNDGNSYQNAYSDLAQMLAEDGSYAALNLLKKHGVEKCVVKRTGSIKKETLSNYSISCNGIMPFLVGALISGKSGADKYQLSVSKEYFGRDGKVYDTPESTYYEANTAMTNYYALAKEAFNGDAEAMLALHVMSEGMGDLGQIEEYDLDRSLYDVFKDRIPERFLGAKLIVVDDERYDKKETRRYVTGIFEGIGLAADIALTVWFFYDIAVAGVGLFSFGKNLFSVVRAAKLGLSFKNIPAIVRIAAKYTRKVFMRQKFVIKIKNMGEKFRKFAKEYKASVRINVMRNAALYTNEVYRQAEVGFAVARGNNEVATANLLKMAKEIKFDRVKGVFSVGEGANKLKVSKEVVGMVNDIVDAASIQAKSRYRMAKLLKKEADFKKFFIEEVETLISGSPMSLADKQTLTGFFQSSGFEKTLLEADNYINIISAESSARNFANNPLILPGFLGAKGTRIGVEFSVGEKMPAFSKNVPEFASVIQDGDQFLLKFFKNGGETVDLSTFKLAFKDSETFADFARASAELGKAGKIDIKFIPKEGNTFWTKNFRNVFTSNKEKLFGGRGSVTLLKDGKQIQTGITLRTYKKYDGLKVFVNEDLGGALSVMRGTEQLPVSTTGAFFLPKYEIKNFLNFAKVKDLDAPYKIKLVGGINKVNALYLQSMVSLSVASTGLVGPLSRNYPDMDMEDLTFISLIFPYLLSAATPIVSPLVKRFGAIKILKTSMGLSLLSLALPIAAGFNGFGGIQADNPFDKPSPSLLYPSAILIGLATTLTRGSYSPLIQTIGGGSGTLKAVAFKSVSSFMLILPPVIGAGIDRISPKYFKNVDGSLYLDENGNPIQKHWFDFSFSYPVMLAVAGAALYKIQKVHFNPNIGKSANSFRTVGEFFKDVGSSYGLLLRKDLVPLTVSSALLAGAESSLLYTYSNSMANEYVRRSVHTEELVPVIALVGLNLPAFITRMNSKPILKSLGGDNMTGYRNMLTFSLATAGVGSYLLATQDDPVTFAAGLTLTSIGFSQITSSILRYGHNKLAELKAPRHLITSWDVSYPTVFIGMSAVPYLYGHMNDRNIAGLTTDNKADMVSLKNTSWQEMMYIPITALLAGGGLSYVGMRPKNVLGRINAAPLIAPLGLAAETHNFTTLTLPKPNFNKPAFYQQPKAKDFEPNFQHNPELFMPKGFQVTPNFTIQPVSQ